jgi:hypothetical protein
MSDVYAGGAHAHLPTECQWESHFDDCFLGCSDAAIPGAELCAAHFIAAAHSRSDSEYAARIARRRRPA